MTTHDARKAIEEIGLPVLLAAVTPSMKKPVEAGFVVWSGAG